MRALEERRQVSISFVLHLFWAKNIPESMFFFPILSSARQKNIEMDEGGAFTFPT
jgi:hypothetical protein